MVIRFEERIEGGGIAPWSSYSGEEGMSGRWRSRRSSDIDGSPVDN